MCFLLHCWSIYVYLQIFKVYAFAENSTRSSTSISHKGYRLVDGKNPTMGYLYEAMDNAKEAMYAYYEVKGDEKNERQQLIWGSN